MHKFTEFEMIGNTLLIGMRRDDFSMNFGISDTSYRIGCVLSQYLVKSGIVGTGQPKTLILRAGRTQSKIRAVDFKNNDSQNLFDIVHFFLFVHTISLCFTVQPISLYQYPFLLHKLSSSEIWVAPPLPLPYCCE